MTDARLAEPAPGPPPSEGGLRRELNLFGAVSMIVGIVIGSGIFLGVNRVAAGAGSPWLIALAWLIGGALTLMGALTYAELGVMFPRAGGAYVFIRESLGRLPAFLLGWTAFTVNLAGSAAALAVIFATQLNALKPFGFGHVLFVGAGCGAADPECLNALGFHFAFGTVKLTAACLVLLVATLNWFGLRLGGNVQKSFTVLKGVLMVFLAVAALAYAGPSTTPQAGWFEDAQVAGTQTAGGASLAAFLGVAMVQVFFAYDGWTNVVTVGSEIKDPARILPRAMLLGVAGVALLYLLVSFGYLHVLGFAGFATSGKTVASDTARVLFGHAGEGLVAAVILVSVLGSLNGITISGPRFYYAMARDRLFPAMFGKVNRHHVPGHSIWVQAALAIVFLTFLNFDQLIGNVVFVSFFFYSLAAVGLIVLRRTRPDLPRPYKVPGYPVVPILYVVASLAFAGYQLWLAITDFATAGYLLAGLAIVACGVPLYYYFRARGAGSD
ncbi:MAG: APC family permease [Thermoplasmatota archaeon]|nr:amino acid permease [Halobacteriales archaeon]